MNTTYTIATDTNSGMLLATVPDGQDVLAAAADACNMAAVDLDPEQIEIRSGLSLTDDVADGDLVVYTGTALGYLTDENDITYQAAVIRQAR